jgi:putative acetyltransferase
VGSKTRVRIIMRIVMHLTRRSSRSPAAHSDIQHYASARAWLRHFCPTSRSMLNAAYLGVRLHMEIRPYQESDYVEIADLFHTSVHSIDRTIYSEEELEAWAPTPPNYEFWKARLAEKKPFVAVKSNTIVGFIELESNGHIDCLYVHKGFQGLGIASSLLKHVMQVANDKGINKLHVEASKVAMPLFKKYGFELLKTNTVNLRGQSLTNYCMSSSSKP